MYLAFLVGLLILAAIAAWYFLHYKPKKTCQEYVRTLTRLGYRVYAYPFKTFGFPIYEAFDKAMQEHKDALYNLKETYQGYDVLVGNVNYQPHLVFLDFKLGNQIAIADKTYTLHKAENLYKLLVMNLGKNVFFYEGELWTHHRKIMKKFFTFEYLKNQTPYIVKICDEAIQRMEVNSKINDNQFSCQIWNLGLSAFAAIASGGILGIDILHEQIEEQPVNLFAFNVGLQTFSQSFDPLVIFLGEWAYKLRLRKSFKEMQRKFKIVNDYSKKRLQQLRYQFENMTPEEQRTSPKMIHAFLLEAKGDKNTYLTDQALLHQITNYFFAGSDVNATVFTWMIIKTFENPEIQQRVRAQISGVLKPSEEITYEHLKQMTYIDCLQMEATRMFPPAISPFDRFAIKDIFIGDIPVKKNTIVNYFPAKCLYDENFFPDAKTFKPERWAEKTEHTHNMLNMVMMYFGAGSRFCLGKNLAMLECKIAFIKFMLKYKNLKPAQKICPILDITYRPKNGNMIFEKI